MKKAAYETPSFKATMLDREEVLTDVFEYSGEAGESEKDTVFSFADLLGGND